MNIIRNRSKYPRMMRKYTGSVVRHIPQLSKSIAKENSKERSMRADN